MPRPVKRSAYGTASPRPDKERGGFYAKPYVGGRRLTVRGATAAEVEAKVAAKLAEAEAATRRADAGTVEAIVVAWLDHEVRAEAPSANTLAGWRRDVAHITRHLGDLPAADLDVVAVEAMLIELVHRTDGRPLGRRALRSVRATLNRAVRHAVRTKTIKANPGVLDARLPGAAAEPRPRVWHDREEHARVLAYVSANPTPETLAFLVMAHAGLRPGEALALPWSAVEFGANTLRVDWAMRLDHDGARRPSERLKTDHKTTAAHRGVPMTPELRAALLAEAERQLAAGTKGVAVFDLTRSALDTTATRMARGAGVPRIHPNAYRHTFASILRAHPEVSDEEVAEAMGHKGTRMLTLVYSHPVSRLDARRLGEAFGAGVRQEAEEAEG